MDRPSATRACFSAAALALAALSQSSFASTAGNDTRFESTPAGDSSIVLELASYRAGETPAQRVPLAVNGGGPELITSR